MSAAVPNSDGDDATHKWSELLRLPRRGHQPRLPDADFGTYEYFFEAAPSRPSGFRSGEQSADDNATVSALTGDETAIGHFGYAYFQENWATLTACSTRTTLSWLRPAAEPLRTAPTTRWRDFHEPSPPPTLRPRRPPSPLVWATAVTSWSTPSATSPSRPTFRPNGSTPQGEFPWLAVPTARSPSPFLDRLPRHERLGRVYEVGPGVTVTVEGGGSGAGAGRVCANSEKGSAVDIGDMSRGWKSSEASVQANGFIHDCLKGDTSIDAAQFVVAVDGLSVVVKKGSAAETCINGMGGLAAQPVGCSLRIPPLR